MIHSVNHARVVKHNTISSYYAEDLAVTSYLTHAHYWKIIHISAFLDNWSF